MGRTLERLSSGFILCSKNDLKGMYYWSWFLHVRRYERRREEKKRENRRLGKGKSREEKRIEG